MTDKNKKQQPDPIPLPRPEPTPGPLTDDTGPDVYRKDSEVDRTEPWPDPKPKKNN
ncbi:MAG: hypothetical protein GY847_42050 [Proteobacteria bacterium]|nr:hypothetical protein [Pseudomonadota bacterium]